MDGGGVELVDAGGSSADGVDGTLIRVISVEASFRRHSCFVLGDFRWETIGLGEARDCLSKRIKKSKSLYFC
jgi:hypothetical protein